MVLNPDDAAFATFAEILWGQAVIAEGGRLPNPAAFAGKLVEVAGKALAT